jgi:hypothetical protein
MDGSLKDVVITFTFLAFILFLIIGMPYLATHLGAETTGVCIFKGPFSSGGFFGSSSGIPLRGIGVTAWHPGGFGGQIIDSAGPTDRNGCFTLQAPHGGNYFISYTYNGTGYTDPVQPGVILRDNVP